MGLGVSVIICTFNGKQRIGSVLDALELQKGEYDWEVIIVDNYSTDGTSDWVKTRLNYSQLKWILVQETQPGLSFARLAGIRKAKFDFLLFCDDDNILFPDYLQIGYELLMDNPQVGVVGGEGSIPSSTPKPDWFDRYSSSYAVGPQGKERGEVSIKRGFVYGAGSFFRKATLLEIFDSEFQPYFTGRKSDTLTAGDDVELCLLMKLKGFEIWFDPGLRFYHVILERRLIWDYYLQLKAGITAGAAVFFSYEYFMRNGGRTILGFRMAYFKRLAFHQLLLFKNIFLGRGKASTPDDQLAKMILAVKAESFRTGFEVSKNHFIQLRNKF